MSIQADGCAIYRVVRLVTRKYWKALLEVNGAEAGKTTVHCRENNKTLRPPRNSPISALVIDVFWHAFGFDLQYIFIHKLVEILVVTRRVFTVGKNFGLGF